MRSYATPTGRSVTAPYRPRPLGLLADPHRPAHGPIGIGTRSDAVRLCGSPETRLGQLDKLRRRLFRVLSAGQLQLHRIPIEVVLFHDNLRGVQSLDIAAFEDEETVAVIERG